MTLDEAHKKTLEYTLKKDYINEYITKEHLKFLQTMTLNADQVRAFDIPNIYDHVTKNCLKISEVLVLSYNKINILTNPSFHKSITKENSLIFFQATDEELSRELCSNVVITSAETIVGIYRKIKL